MRIPLRRGGRARGQSLVEFALVIPIIAFLIFGVLDVGVAVYRYNTLSEAARQANRMAIVNQDVASIQDEAVAFAPALNLDAGNDVDVCFHAHDQVAAACPGADTCSPAAMGCLAYVNVETTYSPITPLIGNFIGTIPLRATSVGPIEYACHAGTTPSCP